MESVLKVFENLFESVKHLFGTNCELDSMYGVSVTKINNTFILYLGTVKFIGRKDIINYKIS